MYKRQDRGGVIPQTNGSVCEVFDMGIALDQGRGCRIAATGVQGVAKGGEVGAQLIGDGAGAFGWRWRCPSLDGR